MFVGGLGVTLHGTFHNDTSCPQGRQLVSSKASIPREGKVKAAISFMTQLWESNSIVSAISCWLQRSVLLKVGSPSGEYQVVRISWVEGHYLRSYLGGSVGIWLPEIAFCNYLIGCSSLNLSGRQVQQVVTEVPFHSSRFMISFKS